MSARLASRFSLAIMLAGGTVWLSGPAIPVAQTQAPSDDPALVTRARGIHERVLTLDTHNDIDPNHFTQGCNYTMRLTTQVNLPKMIEGGLDVSFMIAYVGQGPLTPEGYAGAYREAVAKFDAVHRLTGQIAPDRIGLALTAADVRRIAATGRKVAVIGIENGYPIGTDVNRVREFWKRGGRYMSLAHNGHSQLSDSNNGEASNQWLYGGLSPLGRQVIAEMNRWGIMVDVSHPSKGSIMQTFALSKAPVIASHSAVRALANHSRNMDNEMLMALKQNGGVIQTVAFATYVKVDPPERTTSLTALRQEFGLTQAGGRGGAAATTTPVGGVAPPAARGNTTGAPSTGGATAAAGGTAARGAAPAGRGGCPVEGAAPAASTTAAAGTGGGRGGAQPANALQAAINALPPARRADYDKRLAEIDARWPAAGRATVRDFVDHIDYLVKLIGIDHVGISSDFDGGGGVTGWNSAAETFNVTLELVRRGYTEEQIGKIWSGNLLRVWEAVEKVAADIQAGRL